MSAIVHVTTVTVAFNLLASAQCGGGSMMSAAMCLSHRSTIVHAAADIVALAAPISEPACKFYSKLNLDCKCTRMLNRRSARLGCALLPRCILV